MNARALKPKSDRAALIAKVHVLAKQAGLDDDARRDLMERETGKRSAAACSEPELVLIVGALQGRPAAAGGRRIAASPMARKARAMWISLHQLGVVRDPSERSLEAFGKRQLGVDRLQWADEGQAFRLIEALKAMAERAGWNQDTSAELVRAKFGAGAAKTGAEVKLLKIRLAELLWDQAIELGAVKDFGGRTGMLAFLNARCRLGNPGSLNFASIEQLELCCAELARITAAKRAEQG